METMQMANEARNVYFADKSSLGNFSVRGAKAFAEWLGGCFKEDTGTSVISVYGGLGNAIYDSWFSTYTELSRSIERSLKDEKVKNIALVINSPGGMAEGLLDCCNYIQEARKVKPISAYITGMACSAAYAIAVSCDKVYGIAEGSTGCCGCYAEVLEVSEEKLKEMGFLHRIFRSANAPKKNLSVITDKEAGEEYQKTVTALGDSYLSYVSSCRGIDKKTAEKTFGQGAVVTTEYAVENGMIDGICSIESFFDFTSSASPEESEGEDMDITKMTAEEQQGLFDSLCAANPSLISERMEAVRLEERQRIATLDSLRNGSGEIDAIVDSAVANGKTAESVALDVIKAMQSAPVKATEKAGEGILDSLVEATETVAVPSAAESIDSLVSKVVEEI